MRTGPIMHQMNPHSRDPSNNVDAIANLSQHQQDQNLSVRDQLLLYPNPSSSNSSSSNNSRSNHISIPSSDVVVAHSDPMPPFESSANEAPRDNGSGGAPVKRELSPSDSSTSSSVDTAIMSQSIMMAVAQINMCDVPLRIQVFNSLKNPQEVPVMVPPTGDQSATVVSTTTTTPPPSTRIHFSDILKLDANPVLYRLENDKLEELKNACTLLRNPYEHITRTVKDAVHLADAIKVTEAAIFRLIKMSKRLSSFHRLTQIDQIALLKNSIIEMMCIRATTNFHSESNFWYFIDDQNQGLALVSMEVLKEAKINFITHKNFAIKFNSQFGTDPTIADLLTAIILFRPSRATVTRREIIEEEFLNYCYLLRRYLQMKFQGNSCLAKSSYITLMHMLEELYHLSDEIIRIYLDMNPEDAGQLFVELFDLK